MRIADCLLLLLWNSKSKKSPKVPHLSHVSDLNHWKSFPVCCSGHENVVKILVENGANANAVGKDGESPLHVAVTNGKYFYIFIKQF